MSGRRRAGPSSRRGADWSWHRLDLEVARSLVADSTVGPGDLVLDLGAGDGVVTRHLVDAGARVVAFELHPGRAAELRRRWPASGSVKVVSADVRDLRLPGRPFRVVANPPFDGLSAILVRLTSPASRLVRADLVVPRSVAAAWSARLDRRGSRFGLRVIRRVPRSAFVPRPRIDCCVVAIEPRSR